MNKTLDHCDPRELGRRSAIRSVSPRISTVSEVVAAVAAERGLAIEVRVANLASTEIFGICFVRGGKATIVVAKDVVQLHFMHTVLHELGHLSLGHTLIDTHCAQGVDDAEEVAAESFAVEVHRMIVSNRGDVESRADAAADRFVTTVVG